MEEVLKRLLEAEAQAEAEVQKADQERSRTIQEAIDQARRAEQQFADGVPELRRPYLEQAEERARQSVSEMRRRYEERQRRLRALAESREAAAVEAVVALILDPDRN